MIKQSTLSRFHEAQKQSYPIALSEIKNRKKLTHWMWYIFPQISGLAKSELSKYYAIANLTEAEQYLADPILGKHLIEITSELAKICDLSANTIFGSPDDLKLCSCMTLFSQVPNTDPVFESVLNQFYNGQKDERTLRLIHSNNQ